mmetsp:Transcript_67780/g.157347  ORF Transcript_67780/g.157347 Transcript_67780/m.157347 type:complete len:269 (-) Transcript_67780:203-1009(-)
MKSSKEIGKLALTEPAAMLPTGGVGAPLAFSREASPLAAALPMAMHDEARICGWKVHSRCCCCKSLVCISEICCRRRSSQRCRSSTHRSSEAARAVISGLRVMPAQVSGSACAATPWNAHTAAACVSCQPSSWTAHSVAEASRSPAPRAEQSQDFSVASPLCVRHHDAGGQTGQRWRRAEVCLSLGQRFVTMLSSSPGRAALLRKHVGCLVVLVSCSSVAFAWMHGRHSAELSLAHPLLAGQLSACMGRVAVGVVRGAMLLLHCAAAP